MKDEGSINSNKKNAERAGKNISFSAQILPLPRLSLLMVVQITTSHCIEDAKKAHFSKLKIIPDLISDDKKVKIMENIDFIDFFLSVVFYGKPCILERYEGEVWMLLSTYADAK